MEESSSISLLSSSLKSLSSSAFFEKDNILDDLSYRRNEADKLPEAQIEGQRMIAVKAKTLWDNTHDDKQQMVELKDRKLFDW